MLSMHRMRVDSGGVALVRAESATIGWRMTVSRIELQQAESHFQHRSTWNQP